MTGRLIARIRLLLIAAALLPLLAGSNGPDFDAQDDATCRKSSDPGSEEYGRCRQALAQRREAECKAVRTVIESPCLQPPAIMPPPFEIRR